MRVRDCLKWVLTAATGAAATAAAAQEPVEAGRALAEQLCAECHVIGPEGRGTDAAPSFARIGALPDEAEPFIRRWLVEPHPNMPLFDLSRAEIEALLAYMRSVAPQPEEG